MPSNYKTPRYRLIQLITIACFLTLAPGYAREMPSNEPPLELKVHAPHLRGPNRIIYVTIIRTSRIPVGLNQYCLSFPEQDGQPVQLGYIPMQGRNQEKVQKVNHPLVPLAELIDTTKLDKPGQRQTCAIVLEPNGCRDATLTFSIINNSCTNAKSLAGPVSVNWKQNSPLFAYWKRASSLIGSVVLCGILVLIAKEIIAYFRSSWSQPQAPPDNSNRSRALSEEEIKARIDIYTNGHESLKKDLASAAYAYLQRTKSGASEPRRYNTLVIDPKNAGIVDPLVKGLAQTLGVPYVSSNIADLTPAGYHGKSIDNILSALLRTVNNKVAAAERAIVFLSGMDPLAAESNFHNSCELKKTTQTTLCQFLTTREMDFHPNPLFPAYSQRLKLENLWVICAGNFSKIGQSSKRAFNAQSPSQWPTDRLKIALGEAGFIPELIDAFSDKILYVDPSPDPWSGEPRILSDSQSQDPRTKGTIDQLSAQDRKRVEAFFASRERREMLSKNGSAVQHIGRA